MLLLPRSSRMLRSGMLLFIMQAVSSSGSSSCKAISGLDECRSDMHMAASGRGFIQMTNHPHVLHHQKLKHGKESNKHVHRPRELPNAESWGAAAGRHVESLDANDILTDRPNRSEEKAQLEESLGRTAPSGLHQVKSSMGPKGMRSRYQVGEQGQAGQPKPHSLASNGQYADELPGQDSSDDYNEYEHSGAQDDQAEQSDDEFAGQDSSNDDIEYESPGAQDDQADQSDDESAGQDSSNDDSEYESPGAQDDQAEQSDDEFAGHDQADQSDDELGQSDEQLGGQDSLDGNHQQRPLGVPKGQAGQSDSEFDDEAGEYDDEQGVQDSSDDHNKYEPSGVRDDQAGHSDDKLGRQDSSTGKKMHASSGVHDDRAGQAEHSEDELGGQYSSNSNTEDRDEIQTHANHNAQSGTPSSEVDGLTASQDIEAVLRRYPDLNEAGYKKVAEKKNNQDMATYMRRLARALNFTVVDEGRFMGVVPFYSGAKGEQSFQELLEEFETSIQNDCGWVAPKSSVTNSSKAASKGATATLNEDGYAAVARARDGPEMLKFMRRVIRDMKLEVIDVGGLNGLRPFHSCEEGTKSYEELRLDLETATDGCQKWLAPIGKTANVGNHVSPSAVPLSEEGYQLVASKHNNQMMEIFARRIANDLNAKITDRGGLQGILPFHSCEKETQSFEDLKREIEEAASAGSWAQYT